jgi:hypothetical protein
LNTITIKLTHLLDKVMGCLPDILIGKLELSGNLLCVVKERHLGGQ